MQVNNIFVVHCERISKRHWYYLRFPINDQITQRIKELPEDTRKWNAGMMVWEISTLSLFLLIKRYKGSNKIHFDFGNEDSRKIFIEQIKKLEIAEEAKRKFIAELNVKKEHWVKYKQELEETYEEYSEQVHKFLKPNIKLYPHQIVSVMFLNVVRNALLALDMGTGKTVISIAYCEMNPFNKVFVITPNSLKFNYYNEVEKFTYSKAHIIGKKNTCSIEDAKYIITNYEYFNSSDFNKVKSKFEKLNIGKIDCLISDECFTYDTLIDTNVGKIKIGDIVENKLNVKILSYNHSLKKIEAKSINRYLYNGYKTIIRVKLSNGEIIECTPEHKFFSIEKNEYIPIKDFKYGENFIKRGKNKTTNYRKIMSMLWNRISNKRKYKKNVLLNDMLNEKKMGIEKNSIIANSKMFTLSEGISEKKKRACFMFKSLFDKIYRQRKCEENSNNERIEWKHITPIEYNMPNLWERISSKKKIITKILFKKLFCNMENESSGNKRKGTFKRNICKNIEFIKNCIQGKTRISKCTFNENEIKKSNVFRRNFIENEKFFKGSYFPIERWEWSINKTAIKTLFGNIWNNIYGNGILNTNNETIKRNGNNSTFTTNSLFGRYCNTSIKNCYRSGWKFTQKKIMEIFRQKKNRDIEYVWLESIEILESGNRREFGRCGQSNKKVYDLEIADNHNYFANNILVSNCHRLKSTKSNTYKNFKKLFKEDIFRNKNMSKVFMSGTPAPSKAAELYSVLNQISPIDFSTQKYFYEYYCGMNYNLDGFGWETDFTMTKFDELFNKIAPYIYRKKKSEVLKDLPEKTYQRIVLEMTPREYEVYYDLEEGVANEFVNKELHNPLAIMGKLREYTSYLKVNNVSELIDSILESGEKFVAIDFYKNSLYELHKLYPNISALHTGDESDDERNNVLKDFQDENGKIKIFLGSESTTKEGLTLTAASKVGMLTIPWTPGTLDQCTDRLARIGQKNAVNAYIFIYKDTIDEYIFNLIESKRAEISQVIDGEKYESDINQSIINDLIQIIKNKHKK